MTLLQDIEAATEGSRELSDRVLEALKLWRHRDFPNPPYLDMRKYQRWDTPHRSLWFSASSLNDNRDDIGLRLPDPTRNLQDALQLVPEGCEGQIDFGAPPIDWQIWNGKFGTESIEYCGTAATPALALSAACLRAIGGE